MATAAHMELLLRTARKELREFKRLPPDERRSVAKAHLVKIGIVDRKGRLKPGLQ